MFEKSKKTHIMEFVVKLVIVLISMPYITKWMSDPNIATPKTHKNKFSTSKAPKICFIATSKS